MISEDILVMKTLLTETMEQQNSNLKVIVAMEDVDEMEMCAKTATSTVRMGTYKQNNMRTNND